MTRHLNLLDSAPKPAPRSGGLPVAAAPALLVAVLIAAGAAAYWARHTTAGLNAQLQAARRGAAEAPAASTGRLDATVLSALRQQAQEREADAAAMTGDNPTSTEQAPASRWLAALDEAAASGMALNQVRVEPGPRLTLAGSALRTGDVHAFLARLQQHPLAGSAAIGQLEIRRGETDDAPLSFRLSPPAPERVVAASPPDGERPRR